MATGLLVLLLSATAVAVPEMGFYVPTLDSQNSVFQAQKHMYKKSMVSISVSCKNEEEINITITWHLRLLSCSNSAFPDDKRGACFFLLCCFNPLQTTVTTVLCQMCLSNIISELISKHVVEQIIKYLTMPYSYEDGSSMPAALIVKNYTHLCGQHTLPFQLPDSSNEKPQYIVNQSTLQNNTASSSDSLQKKESGASPVPASKGGDGSKNKRAASGEADKVAKITDGNTTTTEANKNAPMQQKSHSVVATTWTDGLYLFILYIQPATSGTAQFTANVKVSFTWGDNNYISATDYPLLIFYGILGLVYIFYGLIWLVLLACNWRDLLRVQFWIGGVILLGMLEKAVFFAEYENINKTGVSVRGAVIFAELVSCLKRALARMLVIIVSLGFGIVKPRLGQAFHKVLFAGGLFFVLSSIEGGIRVTNPQAIQSNQYLLAAVPLAVLDAVICWWIFTSLIQTMRTLRLRRNVVKLTLYRHFTNTLIFAVLASIGYMIWFMTQHRFTNCVKNWEELWVDDAFWHMLFVLLLFIIMLLWRPTANNQRYAFSPLLDADDDEEEETIMNDAFEGMKMRGKQSNGSPKSRDNRDSKKVEDDLKWVEEHIPSSVADKALPSLLDSDEELMTTKFEMSKME